MTAAVEDVAALELTHFLSMIVVALVGVTMAVPLMMQTLQKKTIVLVVAGAVPMTMMPAIAMTTTTMADLQSRRIVLEREQVQIHLLSP